VEDYAIHGENRQEMTYQMMETSVEPTPYERKLWETVEDHIIHGGNRQEMTYQMMETSVEPTPYEPFMEGTDK
jgi:hypothetical protein